MAVYLSPGVFPAEIDLSLSPTGVGPLRPAFIGTAKKGPLNSPTLVSSATQAIETYGEPFPQSYLMYAVLHFLEEGNQCYVMRVGVECQPGQPAELDDICIDNSGARGKGWGRIPLFTGIDFGRINLRAVSADRPLDFHPASVGTVDYNDVDLSSTDGPTDATLTTTGTYTGALSDSFVMIITGDLTDPTASPLHGATYDVVRNSDGEVVATGALVDPLGNGSSSPIDLGNGLSITVVVSDGQLDLNDTFLFAVEPDNRSFEVSVEGATPTSYQMPTASYTSVSGFVTAFNGLLSGEDYLAISHTLADGSVVPQLRTAAEGYRIQVTGSAGFALECGIQRYTWDIPRSHLLGLDSGPYDITTGNNRVAMKVIGTTSSQSISFNVPVGLGQTASSIADSIDAAGVVSGQRYFESFPLTLTDGSQHVVITTALSGGSVDHSLDTLQLLADYSNLKTLRFTEELEIQFPYSRPYRGYSDNRTALPGSGEGDAATPLSCELDSGSDQCAADAAYFANVVGWLVAPTPGTWLDGFRVSLEVATGVLGDPSGRYNLLIRDGAGQLVDRLEDVSFDVRAARYIANLINPGASLSSTNGNPFVNWEARPGFLGNDPNSSDYELRQPSPFNSREFLGTADGIPLDPAYSSSLDAAVIGNPAESTGLNAFQNPETYDINLLCVPGFSSGSVIGQGLQLCEQRGDVLFVIDPPFGLRPQQVVDWHNGMLLSDLRAAINSSYGALYWGWLKSFDQFSREDVWVPPSGHVAAVFSRTARVAEQWFAPAGLRRGRLLTALDVEYSPGAGERDLLYGSGNAVNAIVKFPQDGIVVYGQRTLQRSQSALDRVGVRMLLIYLKKNLVRTLRNYIFEPNDRILWKQVQYVIEPFLADVAARRGLTGYRVVVDESNNTPERIDRGELHVAVFLKPERSVEFIALNLVLLRTGASFSAAEVLAAGGIVTADA